jgi:hypothetical protein
MSDLSIRDIADVARLKMVSGDPFWPFPMINDLESTNRGSAVVWVIKILEFYLEEFATQENRQLRKEWLEAVPRLYDLTWHEIGPVAREIWCYGGTRDKWQRAISRLYEAVATYSEGRNGPYRRCVAMAVGVLTSDEDGRIDPRRVEQCIYQYVNNREYLKNCTAPEMPGTGK